MGVPAVWQTLIHGAEIARRMMTSRMPLGPGGPLVGGAPPDDRGLGGSSGGTMSVDFSIYRIESPFCIG
jgi:hypothetical protein